MSTFENSFNKKNSIQPSGFRLGTEFTIKIWCQTGLKLSDKLINIILLDKYIFELDSEFTNIFTQISMK